MAKLRNNSMAHAACMNRTLTPKDAPLSVNVVIPSALPYLGPVRDLVAEDPDNRFHGFMMDRSMDIALQ